MPPAPPSASPLALVTGAGRGIGAALREALAEDGFEVVGTRRGPAGPGWISLDVTDPGAQTAMAAALGDRPLDLLVCNAGIFADRDDALEDGFPAQIWADTFATNVTGVFLSVQALLPNLERAGGKVAVISSQMGSSAKAGGGAYVYRAAKAAVLNLGLNLATDLKPRGVAVGIYHPGWVRTDMTGGSGAVAPEDSASGLATRFRALDLGRTGCFETWDGRAHPV